MVIELTSSSTRKEDVEAKYRLYRDMLHVKEYFLFDPLGDYLQPSLQGHRLRGGEYHSIRAVAGRLPSRILGLHLERAGRDLRLYDPVTERWLPTAEERATEAEGRAHRAQAAQQQEEAARQAAEAARRQVEAENERLRQELASLKRRVPKNHRGS